MYFGTIAKPAEIREHFNVFTNISHNLLVTDYVKDIAPFVFHRMIQWLNSYNLRCKFCLFLGNKNGSLMSKLISESAFYWKTLRRPVTKNELFILGQSVKIMSDGGWTHYEKLRTWFHLLVHDKNLLLFTLLSSNKHDFGPYSCIYLIEKNLLKIFIGNIFTKELRCYNFSKQRKEIIGIHIRDYIWPHEINRLPWLHQTKVNFLNNKRLRE